MQYKWACCLSAVLLAVGFSVRVAAAPGQAPTSVAATTTAPMTDTVVEGVLDQYCVTCHNAQVVDGSGAAPSAMVTQLGAA